VLFHERNPPSWNNSFSSIPVVAGVAMRVAACPPGSAVTGPSIAAAGIVSAFPIPAGAIGAATREVFLWHVVVGVGIRACTAITAVAPIAGTIRGAGAITTIAGA
jgi:hypothetical protein